MNSQYRIKSAFAPGHIRKPLIVQLQDQHTHEIPPMQEYHSELERFIENPMPSLTFHPLSLMVVENAVVHERQIVSTNFTILLETLASGYLSEPIDYSEAKANATGYPGSLCTIPFEEDISDITQLQSGEYYCLVASTYNYNFAHWHTESLAAVQAVKDYLPGCKVLVPDWADWQRESVIRAGIPAQDVIVIDAYPIRVPRLVVISTTWLFERDMYRVPPLYKNAFRAIASNLEVDDTIKCLGSRVYLSRLSSPHRRLLNEVEVIHVFEEFGFTVVSCEDVPYAQLLKSIMHAEAIAAPSGAALSRVGFCNPTTKFIELSILGGWQSGWHALASIFGLSDNHKIYVEKTTNLNLLPSDNPLLTAPQLLESWQIDLAALRLFLADVLND